jgi:hypothetical protein
MQNITLHMRMTETVSPIDSVWDADLLPCKESIKRFTGSRPSLIAPALPFSTRVVRGLGQDDAPGPSIYTHRFISLVL